jgi:hypothetical protein
MLNKNKPWMSQAIYFFKIKNASQNILTSFFVSRVSKKNVIFSVLYDDNVSATHVFMKQIFRTAEKAPPSPSHPPPTVLCKGWGSSGSFQPPAVALVMVLKP